MKTSKYKVKTDKATRTADGYVFDSKMEMQYYLEVVKPGILGGTIVLCDMQKRYLLQPGFKKGNKSVRPIYYVADYYLEYSDGTHEVIDIKGFPTDVAKLKRKMFWYKYPDQTYKWLTYKKGSWVEQL